MTPCPSSLGLCLLAKLRRQCAPLQHLRPFMSVSGLPVGAEAQHRSSESPLEEPSAWQLRTWQEPVKGSVWAGEWDPLLGKGSAGLASQGSPSTAAW